MTLNIPKILIFLCLLSNYNLSSQEIWLESFDIPEKGIWGDGSNNIVTDLSGITNWSLDFSKVTLQNEKDYAKTVSTSGGRFEVVDIDGEIVWLSSVINIEEFLSVDIRLVASETGSNDHPENKYLKAFYRIDTGEEISFETFGENTGNWGAVLAEQKEISGKELQIIVRMANTFASDKVILDEVLVSAKEKPPEPLFPGDLLISEVLFNPVPGGSDFVEIYNNTRKEISLNRLFLASRDKNHELTQVYPLSSGREKFLPETYLALTKDTNGIFPWFPIQCYTCFLQMEKFPSFNNDEDYVVLLDENRQVIDELFYTQKMHHPILADEEGISLERVSFTEKTNAPENWHSASTTAGYGTPGYKNSQSFAEEVIKPLVRFHPESFSPDFDGYNDEYQISYELDKPGYVGNISVFDDSGRFLFKLVNNEILSASGTIVWNGEDQTGQKLDLGVYIVLVELFHPSGGMYRFKDGVVLTGFLK
jgi:hypothetical protein